MNFREARGVLHSFCRNSVDRSVVPVESGGRPDKLRPHMRNARGLDGRDANLTDRGGVTVCRLQIKTDEVHIGRAYAKEILRSCSTTVGAETTRPRPLAALNRGPELHELAPVFAQVATAVGNSRTFWNSNRPAQVGHRPQYTATLGARCGKSNATRYASDRSSWIHTGRCRSVCFACALPSLGTLTACRASRESVATGDEATGANDPTVQTSDDGSPGWDKRGAEFDLRLHLCRRIKALGDSFDSLPLRGAAGPQTPPRGGCFERFPRRAPGTWSRTADRWD